MKNIIFIVIFMLVVGTGTYFVLALFYNDGVRIAESAAKLELKMITKAVANDLNYILSDSGRDLKLITSMFEYKEIPSADEFNSVFNNYLNPTATWKVYGSWIKTE